MKKFEVGNIVAVKGYKKKLNKKFEIMYKVCNITLVGKHELLVEEIQPSDYYSHLFKVHKANCTILKSTNEIAEFDHTVILPEPGDLVGVTKDAYSNKSNVSAGLLIEIIQKTDLTSKMAVVRIGEKEKVFPYKNLILVE